MVTLVRKGASLRAAAEKCGVTHPTVRLWVERAGKKRLDRVDWSDGLPGRREPVNRTATEMEDLVLAIRVELREKSNLGDFGAAAILRELEASGKKSLPSERTIGRILERRGALDGRGRTCRPAPPRGWYLPDVAEARAELDSFDFVEGLIIQGGPEVEVLNGMSLIGGLPVSWPSLAWTSRIAAKALIEHWGAVGCPQYAQFDNDTRFQGPHQYPDVIGRVSRVCLSLGVVPVFVPPREPGFQAAIENFNGRWQSKVWTRFHHESLRGLRKRSTLYIEAFRTRAASRIEAAPERIPIPSTWSLDLQAPPRGEIIYLRRTTGAGTAEVLGQHFLIERTWVHRLVRAVVDLDQETISFYALRRADPSNHRLIRTVSHRIPHRRFRE